MGVYDDLPMPPFEASNPTDAIDTALTLLMELTAATRRCANALERISDEQYAQNRPRL